MITSNTEETSLLIFKHSIPLPPSDIRQWYEKQLAVYLILTSTLFERIAFYALAANIVVILKSQEFSWNSPNSAIALYIFSGTSYISTLLFAAITDAKLGRVNTIIIGFIPYLIGYIMITLILFEKTRAHLCYTFSSKSSSIFHENCAPSILAILVCIAIGAGAVQSNMIVFGAEQMQQSKIIAQYFYKYMVAVNIGGIIATSVIPYIENNPGYYYIGCIVATIMLFVAAVLFIIGRRYYIHIKPYDTVITMCFPVVISACQTWCRDKINKRSIDRERSNSTRMSLMGTSADLIENEESMRISERPSTFIDFAKAVYNGKFHDRIVDNVKSLRGAFAVFIILIPYWLIYEQLNSTFPLQGQQMNTLNDSRLVIWISLADPVTIIISIFILNMFVYKYLNIKNRVIEITTKFIIGMCFASITMCITGIVESIRQTHCDLSIYYQLPQNMFMGLSEVFTTVASYEYAYFAAPRSAQSLFMSLCFCSTGISSFIGTAYIHFFSTTFVELDFRCLNDKNFPWNFSIYFYILAILQLFFIFVLILCQKKFQIIKLSPEKMEDNPIFVDISSPLIFRS